MGPLEVCVRHGVKRSVEYGVFHRGLIIIMLPIIAGVMSPDLMFAKHSINFINSAMFSNNIVIKTITRMGMASCHSGIGANTRHLHACLLNECL